MITVETSIVNHTNAFFFFFIFFWVLIVYNIFKKYVMKKKVGAVMKKVGLFVGEI